MPPKQPTPLALARMVLAVTRQLAKIEARVKKLERLLSSSARPKDERLPREEWLARRRAVIQATNEKRWGTKPTKKKKSRVLAS